MSGVNSSATPAEQCAGANNTACRFYLVTGENTDGEGTMGFQSDGATERKNKNPCQ